MDLNFPQQLEITLIDKAVIGGLLALAAYIFNRSLVVFQGTQSRELARFTQEQTRSLEEFKNRLTLEDESRRNVRLAVAEVAKRVAAASHSICWACWPAKNTPENFKLDHLDKYDEEIHSLLWEIVGARVVLAALSKPVHDQLSPLIDTLYSIDVDMGEAKNLYLKDQQRALQSFAKLHSAAGNLDDQLLEVVTQLRW